MTSNPKVVIGDDGRTIVVEYSQHDSNTRLSGEIAESKTEWAITLTEKSGETPRSYRIHVRKPRDAPSFDLRAAIEREIIRLFLTPARKPHWERFFVTLLIVSVTLGGIRLATKTFREVANERVEARKIQPSINHNKD